VQKTIHLYESYILPPHSKRVSLLDIKKQEFRERKKLLNPILKEQLLDSSTEEEKIRLEALAKKTSFNNLEYFDISYDRHKDLYGFKYENFPKSYHPEETPLNYAHDPDWSVKFHY